MEYKRVQGVETVDEYFECSCSYEAHVLKFSYHPWDEHKELYTAVHLDSYQGFFKRLWLAFKYVFKVGDPCPYGHWDNWNLRKEDAFRLRNLLDRYISVCGLIVEDGVVKEPKNADCT